MVLESKLGIIHSSESACIEEKISKEKVFWSL